MLNDGTGAMPAVLEIRGVGEVPVLAGHALVDEGEKAAPWDSAGVSSEVRRHVSRNSCVGCHGGELGEAVSYTHLTLPTILLV